MNDISEIIKKIAGEGTQVQTYPAKVITINQENGDSLHENEDAYTVNVMRPDGAEIKNVRLKASIQDKDTGFICVPKINSWVLISIIETTETRAFISQYSEIEKIFLRIKKSDNQYMQFKADGGNTELLYKEVKPGSGALAGETAVRPEYKEVAKLDFKDDKSLNVQYFNDEGTNAVQRTTIAHDKVEVNFDEGYQALIDSEKASFKKADDLEFVMDSQFTIKAGGENLKDQLDMLVQVVSKIVVAQGVGPDLGKLAEIKGKISTILK